MFIKNNVIMETKDIDIVAILSDKGYGTSLYTTAWGEVSLNEVTSSFPRKISLKTNGKTVELNDEGKLDPSGECLIFPSREMQDWSKFAWKKGDILRSDNTFCIFNKWVRNDYTEFSAKFVSDFLTEGEDAIVYDAYMNTSSFHKFAAKEYINKYISFIEASEGGKLNLDTLKIEKPKQEFKDGDILYMEVGLHRSKYIFIYCKDNEEFIPTHYCFLNLAKYGYDDIFKVSKNPIPYSIICDEEDIMAVRLATDSEKQQLFDAIAKENKAWDADKKQIVDLPKKHEFKVFQKVLVRDYDKDEWIPGFFFKKHRDGERYVLVCGEIYKQCIPYNDKTSHLLGTTDDWKGGEG